MKFRRQHVLGPFVADFYCHELLLVVEVDGAQHATRAENDAARDAWMEGRGFRVLRIPAVVVLGDVSAAVRMIEREAEEIAQRADQAMMERKEQ